MKDGDKRSWDVWIALVGSLMTFAGILIGVWQFNRGEENKVRLENSLLLKKDAIEFQRKLWLERLGSYRKIAETAGKIVANTNDKTKLAEAISEFTAQYWGAMIFVEDK